MHTYVCSLISSIKRCYLHGECNAIAHLFQPLCTHTHTSQLLSAQLRTIHNSSTFIHTNSKFIWYQNKRSSKHRCNKFGACNCFELQLKHCLIYSYNLPFKYIQLVVRPDRRDSRAEKRWDCKHDTIKCGIRIKCQISHTHKLLYTYNFWIIQQMSF